MTFSDLKRTLMNFRVQVLHGLSLPRKEFPAQFFFYDKKGSNIFKQICQLYEYYITITEIAHGETSKLNGRCSNNLRQ